MAFPKSRILSTHQLIQQIAESNRNGERFCFILGSGASVESGIPSGNELEMRWMNCIMGEDNDLDTPAMDSNTSRELAETLHREKLIYHAPNEIIDKWRIAREKKRSISSSYYFDIYKLRFYPNRRNGYRYLERIMETCEPSLGYHTLSLLLTDGNMNNLVITTNFDNLVEDALFLYTDKKPLVVSHESLAEYIESDIQRPIIAKIHRGLMYAPFNSPETTNRLKEEWREALNYAFSTYTPIVIGYGGGDHSLMSFLEEDSTAMRHGLYWCYRESSGLPEENIQRFVEKKDGYFVSIGGFNALMMEIGKTLFKDRITPTGTDKTLKERYECRIQNYSSQWEKLNKNPEMEKVLRVMNEEEQLEEEERGKRNKLTPWDYTRRGDRAHEKGDYDEAIEAYTKAIELRGFANDYNNRGYAYVDLQEFEKAIADFTTAIQLDPELSAAYNNRGFTYYKLGQYQEAISNFNKAIELDSQSASAYINRACVYSDLGRHQEAIEDYTKAIELDPQSASAYNNRAYVYNELGQYQEAIEDCNKAIELEPQSENPHRHRGNAYKMQKDYRKAIEDYTRAIELNSRYKEAYINRAETYREIGEEDLAKADEEIAAQL